LTFALQGLVEHPKEICRVGLTGEEYALIVVSNLNLGHLKHIMTAEAGIFYQLDVNGTVTKLVNGLEGLTENSSVTEVHSCIDLSLRSIEHAVNCCNLSRRYLAVVRQELDWEDYKYGSPARYRLFYPKLAEREDARFPYKTGWKLGDEDPSRPLLAKIKSWFIFTMTSD
jgi:hypothetical protein